VGSFSELVMSFPLRADVGPDVLASFASIAVPDPDAPPLPPPNREDPVADDWDLDDPERDRSGPWSHDWGALLGASSTTAYIGSDQGATMRWRRRRWVVTSRATWKSAPEDFLPSLAVLGTVIDVSAGRGYEPYHQADGVMTGFFVGYARHEREPRPWLLWADGQRLVAENLNPPGFFLL